MDLTWLDPDRLDQRAVAGAVALLEAVREADMPFLPSYRTSPFVARLRHGFVGDPPVVGVASDGSGRVVGIVQIDLPRWDNTHLADLQVAVDPRVRRCGLGQQLYEAGVERIRAEGRRLVCATTVHHAGEAFLKERGFERALTLVLRRLDLTAVDWDQLADRAGALDAGYELLRLPGEVPDDLLADVVTMAAAINDAPIGTLDIEAEVFSPERMRAFESSHRELGRRIYRVVARERATGVLAGHTVVALDPEQPWRAAQYETSVVRAHRGHRLGYHLKFDLMRWLRQAEPQVRTIDTDNAADNAHMIRVNEELGYAVLATEVEWQRPL